MYIKRSLPRHIRIRSKSRRSLIQTIVLLGPAVALLVFSTTNEVDAPATASVLPGAPDQGNDTSRALGTSLDAELAAQRGRASAVIRGAGGEVLYESRSRERFELASVGKVFILAAYLDLLERENREANYWEHEMLTVMIEESDNRSASDLWSELNGVEGIQAFLKSRGLEPVDAPHVPEEWGEMRASAFEVSELLAGLYSGRLLNPQNTRFALNLLGNIIDEQAWGVGSVLEGSGLVQTYVKNGWYPEEWGWTVNSAGIVSDGSGSYVVVMLTESQPSLEAGVRLIEGAVGILRDELLQKGQQGWPGDSTP